MKVKFIEKLKEVNQIKKREKMISLAETLSDDVKEVKENKMEENEIRQHMAHCYQGECETNCKYGDEDCPAKKQLICDKCFKSYKILEDKSNLKKERGKCYSCCEITDCYILKGSKMNEEDYIRKVCDWWMEVDDDEKIKIIKREYEKEYGKK